MRSKEDLLADIDATLDQLILNAHALNEVSPELLEEEELEALQKTQVSLLARLIHRDNLLNSKQKPDMQKKVQEFSRLHTRLVSNMARRLGKKSKKNRLKLH